MSGEIVNLRRARKQRDRLDAQARAAENRAVHGRAKDERKSAETERARQNRQLDGAKREP
ncbi:MAG: DUF4169 family protein [Hyphomicrobiales bacterium]|nr:DUF4169 family protein [Hyphomicrobiales bacterium]